MKTTSLLHTLVLVALCAFSAACGDDAPTAPTTANVGGTWAGVATVPGQASHLRLSISHIDADEVSGTWVWTVGSDTTGGPLVGIVRGDALSATLRAPSAADQCRADVTATVTASKMTGTYAALFCAGTGGGAIDLTKQ